MNLYPSLCTVVTKARRIRPLSLASQCFYFSASGARIWIFRKINNSIKVNFSSFLRTFAHLLRRPPSKLCGITDTRRLWCLRVAEMPDLSGPTIGTRAPPPSPARMGSKPALDQEKSLETMAEQAEARIEIEKRVPAEPADEQRRRYHGSEVCISCTQRQHSNVVKLT